MVTNVYPSTADSLCNTLHRLFKDYLVALQTGSDLTGLVQEWDTLAGDVAALATQGLLDSHTASAAMAVAMNMKFVGFSAISLEEVLHKRKEQSLDEMTVQMGSLGVEGISRKRPLETPERRSKRSCCSTSEPPTPVAADDYPTPPSSTFSSSKPLPAGTDGFSPSKSEPDHTLVRLWFLQNLSYPYPTNAQKDKLASAAGIARSKVDSDLTNYRRRAGWTSILNEWCGGDRDTMRRLIDKVEAGKEKRQEVLDAVQGCKDYLTMKEEKTVRNDLLSSIRQAGRNSGAPKSKHRTTSSTSSASTGTTSSLFSSASAFAGRPATPRSFSNGSMVSDLSEVSAAADVFFPPTSAASTAEQAAALVAGRKRLVSDVAPGGPVTPPKRLRTEYPFITPGDNASSSANALAAAIGAPTGSAQGENGQYSFFLRPTPLTGLPASASFDTANEGTGYRATATQAMSSDSVWSTDAVLPTVAQVSGQASGAGQAGEAQAQLMNWALPNTWEFQPDVSYGWGAALPPSGSYQ